MKNNLKKLVAAVLCIAMMAAMAGCAKQAEEKNSEKSEGEAETTETTFPERDITMIIPTETGGGSDVIARYLATEVGEVLGVSVVPQNIGGAATAIASSLLFIESPNELKIMLI